MEITSLLLNLALFVLPCFSAAASSNQSFHPSMSKQPIHHDKSLFADVERHCQSVLSSAAELRYDANTDGILNYKLSFVNGDWSQDAGQAPLLPIHGSSADAAAATGHELLEAVPLASFMLLEMGDMVPRRGPRTALNAIGVLSLTITRNSGSSYMEPQASPQFELRPGIARLLIQFQGVYTETKSSESGAGERVLCMVGDTILPACGSNCTEVWEWAKNHGRGGTFKLPVVDDGNILFVLRYPKEATLTTRAVRGETRSTSAKSDAAYFDTIRLVSQLALGYGSDYRFQPEDAELDAVAGCSDDQIFHDGGAMDMEIVNRDVSLCDIIYQSGPDILNQVMEVIPNRDCEGTGAFCSRAGPFETGRPGTSAMGDTAFTRSAAIAMQGLKCDWTSSDGGTAAAARVAAVFRYVSPWEHQPTVARRTGLSGATLSAEGVWNASTGRACMAGCLGVGEEACRYRVTLSVRTAFSMTRRCYLIGRITSMDGSHTPLSFQQRVSPRIGRYRTSPAPPLRMSYIYTKVEQTQELLLRRSEPSGFRDRFVAKSVLSYPNIARDVDDMVSLSNLADNLGLRFQFVGKPPFVLEWIEEPCFELEILSIGTLVGSYSPPFQGSRSRTWIELLRRLRAVENRQILNVSAEFTATRNFLSPIPVMSLEGVYNPVDGRMYLIGCRNVHAPWRALAKRSDLEDGMDCSVEVTVEYPPTTTRWLPMGQTANVSVASRRGEDDPLHFPRSELRTVPVVYRDQPWDELVKPVLEGLLCITVLSVARIVFVPVAFFQLFG